MDSCILPRDVLLIIRDLIPPGASNLATHVNLAAASPLLADQLYDSQAYWRTLVQRSGFSASRASFPPCPDPSSAESFDWQEVARRVTSTLDDADRAVQVVGVDAGSEGVEAQLHWGSVSRCARHWLEQRTFSKPLGSEDVRKGSIRLEMNPCVLPFDESSDGLRRLPKLMQERRVVEARLDSAGREFNLLEEYPVILHSFATCPPDLICWLGPTRIINPNGITVSDVRQTILRAPRASALICFLDDVPYIEGDPSGLSLSPPEWLLAHDRLLEGGTITPQAWAQEEPGSIKLGDQRGLVPYTGGNFVAWAF